MSQGGTPSHFKTNSWQPEVNYFTSNTGQQWTWSKLRMKTPAWISDYFTLSWPKKLMSSIFTPQRFITAATYIAEAPSPRKLCNKMASILPESCSFLNLGLTLTLIQFWSQDTEAAKWLFVPSALTAGSRTWGTQFPCFGPFSCEMKSLTTKCIKVLPI